MSGPSQDNSIEEPCVNDGEAIIILCSYPGIGEGYGFTCESIAPDDWIEDAYLMTSSSVLNYINSTISARGSLYFGETL